MSKIKKGDKVVILAGRDKGKSGEVKRVITENSKLIVDGVNLNTKHRKPTQGNAGGIEKIEMPIHVSNVSLVDPKTGKPTRVGYKMVGDEKVRVAIKSGEQFD